jgi:hypothetical protein
MKIIAHRKELVALRDSTIDFSKIGQCTSLLDYWKLITASKKIHDAVGSTDYSKDEWQGLVFGEPFLNYWLLRYGPTSTPEINFEGISTRTEDGHGVDAWARDVKSDERFAVNHKTFSYRSMVLREHTSGVAWAALRYGDRPMIVTTAQAVSIPVKDDILAARGVVVTYDHIEPRVKHQIFWKEFQEYLEGNWAEYQRRQSDAMIEAKNKSTRALETWQSDDLRTLLS